MSPRLLIFLSLFQCGFFLSFSAQAQLRNANVYFNWLDVGVNTNSGTILPQVNDTPLPAFYSYSGISDEKTGDLIFVTNGVGVCKADFSLMPNGVINSIGLVLRSPVIVPYPNRDSFYYIFYVISSNLYYAIVDMSDGGVVTTKNNLLVSGVVNQTPAVVSYVHKQGWWVITHSNNGNQFYASLVLSNGVIMPPVISQTSIFLEPRNTDLSLRSSNSGNELAATFGKFNEGNNNNITQVYLLDFDKRCGAVNERKLIYSAIKVTPDKRLNTFPPAFSSNDSKLYIRTETRLVQYSNVDYTDSVTCYELNSRMPTFTELFTGVDNNIYVVDANWLFGQYDLYKITNADLPYPQCKITEWTSVKFSTSNFSVNTPGQIMDRSYPDKLPDKLNFTFDNACKQYTVTFSLINEAIYDSVRWFFGDTLSSSNTSREQKPQHTYTSSGDYKVNLVGYICGISDTTTQMLRVREQPQVNLGNDTSVCYKSTVTLYSNLSGDGYLWSNGSEDSSIVIVESGKYWLQVKLGDCRRSDTIEVIENPQIWTALGDEYTICDDAQELVKLDAGEGFHTYRWTPTGDTTQWIVVGDLGPYFVIVNDYRGCRGEDGTRVIRRCPVAVFVPSAFTPNNDGVNDTWKPLGKDVTAMHTEVWNRWGQKVFESDALSPEWDGKAAVADTYVYTITYSGFKNKKPVSLKTKGTFTLLR